MDKIAKGFTAYLQDKMPGIENVEVSGVKRIHGGASRETYRLTAKYRQNGETAEQGMIVRRDPPSSLIETERATEFDSYSAFHGTKVPVRKSVV